MAYSEVDVHIQNPARRGRGKKKMAKKMSAKQIRFFGTKRQKAALKAKRARPAKRRNPPKGGGRVISGYGSTVMNSGRRKKKRNPGNHKIVINTARKRAKTSPRRKTRKNPPELIAFLAGNPAKRSSTKMAKTRRKKRATSHRKSNAGTRRMTKRAVSHRRRTKSNPAGIPLKDFALGGAGGLTGFMGSAAIPQLILGSGNTGMTGYGVTLAAAVGLAVLSHMFFPRQRAVTFGVGIGGAMNLLRRVITDQTPFGSYVSGTGMGDYMLANWGPPRMQNGLQSAMAEAPGTPWSGGGGLAIAASSGVSPMDMADMRASRPC